MSLFSSFNSSYSETQSTEERRDNSTSCEQSIDDRRLDLRKNIRPPVTPLKHKLEVVKQNDDEFVSFDTERIIDTVPPAESFRRNSLTKTPSKRAISPDSKSRDDILYLAKSFRSRSVILPNKATTASSSSGYNSSGKITYDYDYRTVHAPVKLPCARQLKVETQGSGKESSNFFSANGKYYTNIITVDSRDGKGYGRRIRIAPNINKEIFLNCRQGVVISLKMKKLESFRLLRKEKSVGKLIEKFRYLSPQDPISMHYFGFEKMYCISDIVLQEYNPNPSLKSPYVNKNAQFAFENDGKFERIEGVRKKQTNLSYQPNQPKQTVSFHSSVTTSNSFAASFPASVSVSELKKEHGKLRFFFTRRFFLSFNFTLFLFIFPNFISLFLSKMTVLSSFR